MKKRSKTSAMFTRLGEVSQMVGFVPANCWGLVSEALTTCQKLKNSADRSQDFNLEINLADTLPIIKKPCFCLPMPRSIDDITKLFQL